MINPVLSIQSLSVSFLQNKQWIPVVKALSLQVYAGETLAIVGESGSGKSVSSLSILKLLDSNLCQLSGELTFFQDNKPISLIGLSEKEIQRIRGKGIAMIFQEPMAALNPVLTCGEQVAEMIKIHQPDLSKQLVTALVLSLFNEVELPRPEQMMRNYPHQLSGGQQQRVMIAMALANNPALLIADEPTTALDPEVQEEIILLLKQLQQKNGMAIIFISHDLDAVQKIADHLVVMQDGRVMESGLAVDVLNHPQNAYTKGLLNCKPQTGRIGFKLPTVKDYLQNPEFKPEKLAAKTIDPLPIIELEQVAVTYTSGGLFAKKQSVTAIKGISFQLLKGETLGIIGPSGCGKSTIGRVIAGWVQPTSGEVKYRNATVISDKLRANKSWAREVQLIFQDPFGSLNPKIKIGAAIAEPMLVHRLVKNKKEARKITEQLLEKVGLLANHFDRYPHEFSGGQRQRIVVARALAVNPKVLICDESVAALDVSVQAQVLNLLNDLQQELGLSYIFISHDHQVIHYFCDRIITMEMGRIKPDSTIQITAQVSEDAPKVTMSAEVVAQEPKENKKENQQQKSIPITKIEVETEADTPVKPTKEQVPTVLAVPDETIADQVSKDLLDLRMKQEHKKMEQLAGELHIPVVIPPGEAENQNVSTTLPAEEINTELSAEETPTVADVPLEPEKPATPIFQPQEIAVNEITETPETVNEDTTEIPATEIPWINWGQQNESVQDEYLHHLKKTLAHSPITEILEENIVPLEERRDENPIAEPNTATENTGTTNEKSEDVKKPRTYKTLGEFLRTNKS